MSSFTNSFPIGSSSSAALIYPEIAQHQASQTGEQPKKSGKALFSNTILPLATDTVLSPSKQRKIDTLPSIQGSPSIVRQVDLFAQTNIRQTHIPTFPSMSATAIPRVIPSMHSIEGTPPSSPVRNSSSLKAPKSPNRNPRREITSRFALRALEILSEMKITEDMQIRPMIGMRGEHSQVYQILGDRSLIAGVSNDDIYIKIFQEEVIRKEGNAIEREFLTNILGQYNEIRAAGIRVVNILNVDTVSTDGYFAVEKLTPFTMPWNTSTKLSDLSLENKAHIDYLLTLFRFGLTNPSEVAIDIHRGNFGLDKSGNLVLLDLMEDDDITPYAFRLYAKLHARSLSNGSEEIYTLFKEVAREIVPEVYSLMCEES
ncbi:MAG: hypothetical protein FJZ57_00180 [Chlamydiae bacterium]|nr:hypothetical protein [Chlamydiota bacterium]